MSQPVSESLTHKLLRSHLTAGELVPGTDITVAVDQVLIEDATGTMCAMQYELLGAEQVQVPLAVMYVDHNVLQIDDKNMQDHRYLESFSHRYGLRFSPPGHGISHYVHLERFGRPGEVLVGADSHTTSAGALGMFATGAGGLEVAVAMAGYGFDLPCPRVVGVELTGALRPGVEPKDVILELLRRHGVRGGRGAVFEFFGDGVAAIPTSGRATVCNMVVEAGATAGVFPSDEETRRWLESAGPRRRLPPVGRGPRCRVRRRRADRPVRAGAVGGAAVVAGQRGAGRRGRRHAGRAGVRRVVGEQLVRGPRHRGRDAARQEGGAGSDPHGHARVAADPGHDHPFRGVRRPVRRGRPDAGAGVRALRRHRAGAAEGPAVAAHVQPELPRPQRDRRGRGVPVLAVDGRGERAERGDHRPADPAQPELRPAVRPDTRIHDHHIDDALPPERRSAVVVERGENLVPPPLPGPLPEEVDGEVLIVVPDDMSTGDMAPDGAIAMSVWSNIAACARFMFGRLDPAFPDRAQERGGGLIVGGHNYGQGSSREHAALAPLHLGVRVIAAGSYARIHRRNLIAVGVVPLVIGDDDRAATEAGQRWRIPGLADAVRSGDDAVTATVDGGRTIRLELALTQGERAVLAAGGLLAHVRSGARPRVRVAGPPAKPLSGQLTT